MLKGNSIIRFSLLFVILVILQVTVLNRISFFNIATPIVYIYLIIKLPIGLNRNISLIIGFLLGFIIDIFCNTPGINAAATTLVAFMRKPIQGLFFVVEDYEDQIPQLNTLKSVFIKYAVSMTLIHHLALMSLESFSVFNIKLLLLRVLFSTILTSILIFAFEGFAFTGKKE